MISSYVHQGQQTLRRWIREPGVHRVARGAAHVLAGFCLSAASLDQGMLPLVSGLVWACRGWRAVLVAAGGMAGYGLLCSVAPSHGLLWTGLALAGVLLLGQRSVTREQPMLIPAVGMLMVSGAGLGFQILAGDTTSIPLYLLRVMLGGACPWLFSRWLRSREPILEWICWGLFTLGLAQLVPVPWLGLGFVAAGAAAVRSAFPGAAVVGLALDLAGITPVPMTAVTVLSYLLRLLPKYPRWAGRLAPGCVGVFLMYICGRWDLMSLPGLFLGGVVADFFTPGKASRPRRGEVGAVQVRLEMAAGVLGQTRQLMTQEQERFVDTDGLVQRAVCDACGGCAARAKCRDSRKMAQLSGSFLQKPLLSLEELPVRCKKGGRVLAELRRAQDQLRMIQADRQRQQEYREAVIQQYDFMEAFLRSVSDELAIRKNYENRQYDPVVFVYGNREACANADRCMDFSGVQNRYYIILCDGMGSGGDAVREGQWAADLLQRMLRCGFPAEHALESLNSICALRDRAAAVTVDLTEICLVTGKTNLYKWGSPASYLVGAGTVEKLGTHTAPPGLSIPGSCRMRCSTVMGKGQTLLMVSDGLPEESVLEACKEAASPAVLAQTLLRQGGETDDATIVTVRLISAKS